MKTDKLTNIVLAVIGTLLLAAILYGIFGPKKINWKDSYSLQEKRPFGCYVLNQELKTLFPEAEIEEVRQPALDQLAFEDFASTTYLFINDELPFHEYDVDELIRFVHEGNQVFLAAEKLPYWLEDSLGFYVEESIITDSVPGQSPDSIRLEFIHPDQQDSPPFAQNQLPAHIVIRQHDHIQPLLTDSNEEVYAIRISLGEGQIFVCTFPRFFSNYYLLKPGHSRFVNELFAYIPNSSQLWWDEYYKVEQLARSNRRKPGSSQQGFFSYLMEQEAFAWAIWIMLGTILLYAIFEVKRTQRMIPIMKPLPNTTLDFTETVGRLYFHSRDHQTVALKRIKIFLAHVRNQYNLRTGEFSEDFIQTLAGKSGLNEEDIRQLCQHIDIVRNQGELTEHGLVELSAKLEHFYQHAS